MLGAYFIGPPCTLHTTIPIVNTRTKGTTRNATDPAYRQREYYSIFVRPSRMAALRYGAIRTCVSVPFGSLQVQNESSYTRRSLNLIEKSPLAYVTDILIIRQKGQRSRSRGPVRNSNRRRVITDKTSAAEKLTVGGAARFNRVTACRLSEYSKTRSCDCNCT